MAVFDRSERVAFRMLAVAVPAAWLLDLVDPQQEWPGAIRRVFAALEANGVTINETLPSTAPATGDLAAARGDNFLAQADGSVQLIRAQGSATAAEDVAALREALRAVPAQLSFEAAVEEGAAAPLPGLMQAQMDLEKEAIVVKMMP